MSSRRRWAINLGIAIACCLAVTLAFAVSALISDVLAGNGLRLDYIPLALLAGVWLAILVAIAVVVCLALCELLRPSLPARRLGAILIGAVVLSAYVLVSQSDQLGRFSPNPGLLVIPAIGAVYGALVRLPPGSDPRPSGR